MERIGRYGVEEGVRRCSFIGFREEFSSFLREVGVLDSYIKEWFCRDSIVGGKGRVEWFGRGCNNFRRRGYGFGLRRG